jgi:ribosomal protein L11 methyltransferase
VPYRIDLPDGSNQLLDRLIELGALDIERSADGAVAALMPDSVTPEQIAEALEVAGVTASPAIGRDAGSVWLLRPSAIRVGRLQIVPAHLEAEPGALRLIDAPAFGTGLHPTTALCLETLEELLRIETPEAMLDVGTGSGVLALAALRLGVPRALALDIDDEALHAAAENARVNGLQARVQLARGGPEAVEGTWPLVTANILAAPLIEMAPSLVRRIGPRGRVVLSGIRESLEEDVDQAYRHLGMRRVSVRSRAGWIALVMHASW